MHNMTVHHQPLFFHQEPYSLLSKKLSEQRQQYSFNNFTELEMTRFLYNDDGRIFTVLFNFTDIIYTDNISNNTLRQNISLNTILAEFNSSLYVYNRVPNIILISVYATLFLLALFSNILIIVSVYWFQRLRR